MSTCVVLVKGHQSVVSGSALVYFEVNQSPSLGRCTFKPDVGGVEMTTIFTVYCFGWTDLVSQWPLSQTSLLAALRL